jgi:hypothetical protein
LQMHNGQQLSRPPQRPTRPPAGASSSKWPEAEKADPEAIASRDGSLRIEKARLFQGTGSGALALPAASALHQRGVIPEFSPKTGNKACFRAI